MKLRSILIRFNRLLRPVVDGLGLNAIARPIWAVLWRCGSEKLVQAKQNDRLWWLHPEVALRGEYQEIETIHWLREVVKPGMTVIDVGANVGQMTMEMAHLVGASGQVIAIEPAPVNLAILRAHVSGNGFSKRVKVIAAAVCAQDQARLEISVPTVGVSGVSSGFQLNGIGLQLSAENRQHAIGVETLTLDGLCERDGISPAVIKIDVEGAEWDVLKGASDCLSRHRPRIRFGFHPFAFTSPADAQKGITDILTRCGLRLDAGARNLSWTLSEYTAGASN